MIDENQIQSLKEASNNLRQAGYHDWETWFSSVPSEKIEGYSPRIGRDNAFV